MMADNTQWRDDTTFLIPAAQQQKEQLRTSSLSEASRMAELASVTAAIPRLSRDEWADLRRCQESPVPSKEIGFPEP